MTGTAPSLSQLRLLQQKKARLSLLLQSPAGWRVRYKDRPDAFVLDCLAWAPGEGPTGYQLEVLHELPRRKRVAVRSLHGAGKTSLAAWVVLWFALTRDGDDWKVVTTAGAWRQLAKYLWPEVHKWARRVRWDRVGRGPFDPRKELMDLSLKLSHGEAFAAASDQASLIEGAHARRLLYLFDEAKSIPAATWDAAEGAFAGGSEALALALSTPGEPSGRFYDIHARRPGFEDWWARHVTLKEALSEGRVSPEWVEQRKRQWGEGSALYQNRVLGEFASSAGNTVIPLSWVERSVERWHAWQEAGHPGETTSLGVDVADGGEDETVIAVRKGDVISEIRSSPQEDDTMATAGRVAMLLRTGDFPAVVDTIGVGAGVVARLREQGLWVEAFQAAARSEETDESGELEFLNRRAAGWWRLRSLLDPAGNPTLALPPDDLLIGELTAPAYKTTSNGRIQIESKDEIRKRLGRSTDRADAVMMACSLDAGGLAEPLADRILLGGNIRPSMDERNYI